MLVDACLAGREATDAMQDLIYADDVMSVEAFPMGPDGPAVQGLVAVRGKSEFWYTNHDIHAMSAVGPFVNGDRFTVIFNMDVTAKAGPMGGQRMQGSEIALYTTANGKVVCEEFFSPPMA